MNKMLASAVFAVALVLPLVANAQDGVTGWANAGGTDPARNLVGLGIRSLTTVRPMGRAPPPTPHRIIRRWRATNRGPPSA